ncbi:MAG: VCBS repeat-containing protein [Verrucomicrobia bacterium]|nr:VCBS repeat-containing protein [Verrucomicrobiota bacterium]
MHLGKFVFISTLAASLSLSLHAAAPAGRFGFAGPEIFPIDQGIANLHSADIDGDGYADLIVVNNARSKITILYNLTGRKGVPRKKAAESKREMNELPPGARFEIDSIASEKRISALVVADLNGDGRPDLAYYGEPRELVVQYNDGKGGWSAPKRWILEDVQLTPNALTPGDLNGDGRTDLVLLGENNVYLMAQDTNHNLGEPQKIPFTGAVKSVQVLDLNGDGRDDLLLVNWEHPNPFRVRFQTKAGQLDPELHFTYPQIRSYWADDLDGDHRAEITTIAMNSGHAQVGNFTQKDAEPLHGPLVQGQFQILPLNRTDKPRRGVVWADLDGDGRDDLLVAEPDSGQLTLYAQQKDGSLGSPKSFSTLAGVSDLAVADWHGDGTPDIFLLSADERQVGVTQLDKKGRIAFPKILPLEGKPLAMAVGPLLGKDKPALAVLVDNDGRRSLVLRAADGTTKTQKLAENFKSNPSSVMVLDVDQDGLADLVVLVPYEKIKVLLQRPGKDFEEVDVAPPGGTMDQPWASAADVDGDGKAELLLGQKNFVRAVVLQRDEKLQGTNKWTFVVREQINGAASNSRIISAAPLPSRDKTPNLFLLDAERKSLTLCVRDAAGAWRVKRNVQLPVTDFSSLRPVAIGATGANSIALIGQNGIGWQSFAGKVWELTELDGYETTIKDGYLHDVVSGDLNNDGRKDLVFLETRKNHLDLVMFEKPHQLVPADRWQVFEERTFRGRRGDTAEPREAIIADVTGDKKNDLIIIVHDRILVYPQE